MKTQQMNIALIVSALCIASAFGRWSYSSDDSDSPKHWSKTYPKCGGQLQSPIDIKCSHAEYAKANGLTIQVQSYGNATLSNNGHTVVWSPGTAVVTLTGPTLTGTYQLAEIRFHWGLSENGSEHSIDGQKGVLEMHVVFYSSRYADLTAAVADNEADAVAYVAVLFQGSVYDNDLLYPITTNLFAVQQSGQTVDVPFLNFTTIIINKGYAYSGSITTPPCDEVVQWFVVPQFETIGFDQLNEFRKLTFADCTPLGNNYRPLQALNKRPVYRNFHCFPNENIVVYKNILSS